MNNAYSTNASEIRSAACIVKSLIEHGTDDRYFGSTMQLAYWRTRAVSLGVVNWRHDRLIVTDKGKHWYHANLKQLKQCRGTYWSTQDVGSP